MSVEILRATNSSSKLSQRKHCPGSANAEKGKPQLTNEAALEGTMLHFLDANQYEPREKLTQVQREVLDRNESLRTQFLERELPRLGISPQAKVVKFTEREFLLCDFDGEPIISHGQKVPGHPDLIHWYPEFLVAIIFDSKFGRIEVTPAWLNAQLKSYFVMFSDNFNPETVIVAITQPWAKQPNDFHSAEYSAKDLDACRQELIDIIRATEPLDAPRHASIEGCTYCLDCDCPIAISAATDMAVVKINDLTIEQMEEVGEDMRLAQLVIDRWKARMKYIADNSPGALKLYELKSTGSIRSVANTHEAVMRLAKVIPANADEDLLETVVNICNLSLPKAEDLAAVRRKISASKAKEEVESLLGDLIAVKEKERALVKKTVNVHAGKEGQ